MKLIKKETELTVAELLGKYALDKTLTTLTEKTVETLINQVGKKFYKKYCYENYNDMRSLTYNESVELGAIVGLITLYDDRVKLFSNLDEDSYREYRDDILSGKIFTSESNYILSACNIDTKGQYMYFMRNDYIMIYRTSRSEAVQNLTQSSNMAAKPFIYQTYFTAYVIGNYKRFDNSVKKLLEFRLKVLNKHNNTKGCLTINYINNDNSSLNNKIINKSWNDIFIPREQKIRIDKYIKNFYNETPNYIKYGWQHKINILLHGMPGSGKTSIGRIIGTLYHPCNLYQNDWNVDEGISPKEIYRYHEIFTIDKDNIQKSVEVIPQHDSYNNNIGRKGDRCGTVIIIEEVDEIIGTESESVLMKLLDGEYSLQHTIVVCCTNYLDKIKNADKNSKDTRILDRFNLVEEIDGMDADLAIQMVKRFNMNPEDVLLDDSLIGVNDRGEKRYIPRRVENKIKMLQSQSFSEKLVKIDLDSEN